MEEFRKQREQLRREHSALKSESKQASYKSHFGYNKKLLLPAIAALALAPVVGWLALKPDPERIRFTQIDPPDPRYSMAINSPAADQLEGRIASLTGNMEKLSGLITDLESSLVTTENLEKRVSGLTENLETLSTLTASIESKELAADKLEKRISNMTKDLQLLSDLAAGIESKQMSALASNKTPLPERQKLASNTKVQVPTATKKKPTIKTKVASAPSAAKPKPVPKDQTSKQEAPRTPLKGSEKSVTTKQATDNLPQDDRPWNINLISTPDKAYAVRFSNKARSKGVSTELQEVTVKGVPYWRVQVTGFPTQSVAQAYAGNIKDKLGLKDTWVMRR